MILSRVISLCFMFCALSVSAIDVVQFEDPVLRERYESLAYELRCPKCQNQNLSDSDSQISEDLRREVARLLREGKTDKEIKDTMVSLYGDFILYRPPVQNNTLVLWLAPAILLGVGVLIFGITIFRRSRLDDDDEEISSDVEVVDSDNLVSEDTRSGAK